MKIFIPIKKIDHKIPALSPCTGCSGYVLLYFWRKHITRTPVVDARTSCLSEQYQGPEVATKRVQLHQRLWHRPVPSEWFSSHCDNTVLTSRSSETIFDIGAHTQELRRPLVGQASGFMGTSDLQKSPNRAKHLREDAACQKLPSSEAFSHRGNI